VTIQRRNIVAEVTDMLFYLQ